MGKKKQWTWKEVLVLYKAGKKRDNKTLKSYFDEYRAETGIAGRRCSTDGCVLSTEDDPQWMGKPITLILDHISGNDLDCRPENLRYVCPNCASQLETHVGGNKDRIVILADGVAYSAYSKRADKKDVFYVSEGHVVIPRSSPIRRWIDEHMAGNEEVTEEE